MDVVVYVLSRGRIVPSFKKGEAIMLLNIGDDGGGRVEVRTCYAVLSELQKSLETVLKEWKEDVKT